MHPALPLSHTCRRAMLGFFGPTYAQAKAATVHPGWFAGGNILYDGPPSSKIRAALDIIAIHQEREAAIPGLADKDRAKFILHIDSVQAMAPVIWVSGLSRMHVNQHGCPGLSPGRRCIVVDGRVVLSLACRPSRNVNAYWTTSTPMRTIPQITDTCEIASWYARRSAVLA